MAKETYDRNRIPLIFDAEDGRYHSFVLSRLQNYESVQVTFTWSDLNALGGTVRLQEGLENTWVDIPELITVMDVEEDAGALQHTDFGNKDVRVLVDFGSGEGDDDDDDDDDDVDEVATEGIVSLFIVAKMR